MLKYVMGPEKTSATARSGVLEAGTWIGVPLMPNYVFDTLKAARVYRSQIRSRRNVYPIVPVETTGTDDHGRITFKQAGPPIW